MHNTHGFACTIYSKKHMTGPQLAPFFLDHAPALKTMHKAGRRGGDSIARGGSKHV